MFPENIVQACSQSLVTTYKPRPQQSNSDINSNIANMTITALKNISDYAITQSSSSAKNTEEFDRELKYDGGTNVMGK